MNPGLRYIEFESLQYKLFGFGIQVSFERLLMYGSSVLEFKMDSCKYKVGQSDVRPFAG